MALFSPLQLSGTCNGAVSSRRPAPHAIRGPSTAADHHRKVLMSVVAPFYSLTPQDSMFQAALTWALCFVTLRQSTVS